MCIIYTEEVTRCSLFVDFEWFTMSNFSAKVKIAVMQSSFSPLNPGMDGNSNLPCSFNGERQCEDGSCIKAVDLCPEEQLMNQNTILIMIVVGLAVVIFLIVLYCFQQRQRDGQRRPGSGRETSHLDEEDNASLYMPPPSYDEVVTTDLYPPTPQMRLARGRMSSSEEPPMTPPPNYDIALTILARSHESVMGKAPVMRRKSSCVSRRSISVDNVTNREAASPSVNTDVTTLVEQDSSSCDKTTIEVISDS